MYIFIIASMLLCLSAMHSDDAGPVRILNVIAILGIHSVLIGLLGLFHVAWHHYLLLDMLLQDSSPPRRVASPPDTINHLETRAYDEQVFGNGDGQLFHGECAICLGSWDPSDRIKVTPCQHAFHEACLDSWLKAARTCAMCRQDLVEAVNMSSFIKNLARSTSPSDEPLPQP